MRTTHKVTTSALLSVGMVCLMTGCATQPEGQNAATGAAAGAAMGAAAGMVVGNNVDGLDRTEGALAGAVIGAVLGGAMGSQTDQQLAHNKQVDSRMSAVEAQANSTVVNISNSNGSVSPVTLVRSGNQWMGPRGELYNSIPTEAQLKPVYGLDK